MDSILQNNQVKIHSASYINGAYTWCKDKLYDSYSKTADVSEFIGATGCTGCTGANYPNLENARKLCPKVYKAYKVQITPSEDTQESYDNVVVPFLDLDDIGAYVKIVDPIISTVRLDIKPEHLDDVAKFHVENEKISAWNELIKPYFELTKDFYENLQSFVLAQYTTQEQIFKNLEQQINGCDPEYKEEVTKSVSKMIEDFEQYYNRKDGNNVNNDNNDEDVYWSDEEPCPPQFYHYCKYKKYIPNDWYDYRHDVSFNGTAKLYIDCHEFTKTYAMIDNFLNNVKDL